MEAKQVYGIERLAARVYDLHSVRPPLDYNEGHGVLTESRSDEAGKRYTSYRVLCKQCRVELRDYAKA
jgi:hypothetical protein